MSSIARLSRQKISTTVSPTTLAYMQALIEAGEARNLADALDLAVERLMVFENRDRLARDTTAYFENLTEEEDAEEKALESALSHCAKGIDFDQ